MATIGQVVYNLEDYANSGGYISTRNNDVTKTISSSDPSYETIRLNIFTTNLVEKFGAENFEKLGIQAPPGTKVVLNSNKTIMIGRTGTYELDQDVIITSITFVRPFKYVLDTTATQQNLDEGIQGFKKAEEERQTSLDALNEQYQDKDKDTAYWNQYTIIQDTYTEAYNIALDKYTKGINGIYVLPYPGELDNDENYEELYNIIVDFVY